MEIGLISTMDYKNCARDIEKAIRENFDGCRLNRCERPIIDLYGYRTVKDILCWTLAYKCHDGRFSPVNKDWGGRNLRTLNFRWEWVVDTHPAILDGFISHVRALEQEYEGERNE